MVKNRKKEIVKRIELSLLEEKPGTERFNELLNQLGKIEDIRKKELSIINPDYLAVIANAVGLLLVMNYEKTDAITTKAFQMIKKR